MSGRYLTPFHLTCLNKEMPITTPALSSVREVKSNLGKYGIGHVVDEQNKVTAVITRLQYIFSWLFPEVLETLAIYPLAGQMQKHGNDHKSWVRCPYTHSARQAQALRLPV